MQSVLTVSSHAGYGDIVPETTGGRIFCVAYSAVGVPFSFFILADIGQILAIAFINIVRWAMNKKCGTTWADRRKERESRIYGTPTKKKGLRSRAAKPNVTMRHLQSVRYSSDPTSTERRGAGAVRNAPPRPVRFDPGSQSLEMCEVEFRVNETSAGLEQGTLPESNQQTCSTITIIHEERKDSTHMDEKKEPINDEVKEVVVKTVDEKDSGDGEFDGNQHGDDVPTLLIFLILISYMCLSGYAFAAVEGWDYGTGVYFVFITLTTIGFGDVVSDQQYTSTSCIFSIIFTVVGLAVTSMCIALAQERASRLGKRLLDFIDSRVGSPDDEKEIDDPEKGPQRPNQG